MFVKQNYCLEERGRTRDSLPRPVYILEPTSRDVITVFIPGKTAALISEFALVDLPSAELEPWFLRLQCRTCPLAEHSDDDVGLIPRVLPPWVRFL